MQVVSPKSMSGVVLDAPEATLLLSTMAVALSNCSRSFLTHNLLSWQIKCRFFLKLSTFKFGYNNEVTRALRCRKPMLMFSRSIFDHYIRKLCEWC
jgi:hypothetical protein